MSYTQVLEALTIANAVRTANRKLCAEIAVMTRFDAFERVIGLVEHPEGTVGGLPVGRLLRAIPRVGEDKAAAMLAHAGLASTPLSPSRKVRSLTERQRQALVHELWRRQP